MVIAGHNGAGKTTCYKKYLRDALKAHLVHHIDPDAIEQEIREALIGEPLIEDQFAQLAQSEASQLRNMYLDTQVSFSFETVFSDPYGDKLNFLDEARRRGYVVALLAVSLESPEKSADRVALRVAAGGHNVPMDRIRARYPRVLDNIMQATRIVNVALLVDNSEDNVTDDTGAYAAFALYVNGVERAIEYDAPQWWQKARA